MDCAHLLPVILFCWAIYSAYCVDRGSVGQQQYVYFTKLPQSPVFATRNGSLSLKCNAVSLLDGEVSISWSKDGQIISSTTRRSISSNGTLNIYKFRKSTDEGIYVCLAKHKIGTLASTEISVQLAKLSAHSIIPGKIVATVGDSVRFNCSGSSVPKPHISWYFNDELLDVNNSRITLLDSLGVLQITDVASSDDGVYKCSASNGFEVLDSLPATLEVQASNGRRNIFVQLLGGPLDHQAVVGESVIFECFVNGFPKPKVRWNTRDGTTLTNIISSGRFRLLGGGNLRIENIQLEDSTEYICSWVVPLDNSTMSSRAALFVSKPPQLLKNNDSMSFHMKAVKAQLIRLTCQFDTGFPKSQVVWFKNGNEMRMNCRTRMKISGQSESKPNYELVMTGSDQSDSGIYQCRASNQAGTAQAVTFLEMESKANEAAPPVNLIATVLNSTSIKLTWKDPARTKNRDKDFRAYSVHVCPTNYQVDGEQELQQVVQPERMPEYSHVFTNLRAYTNYSIYISAYTKTAGSDHSKSVTVLTHEDVPTDYPTVLEILPSYNSIRLRWAPLKPEVARGVVIGYRIQYCRMNSDSCSEKTVNVRITETLITAVSKALEMISRSTYILTCLTVTALDSGHKPDCRLGWSSEYVKKSMQAIWNAPVNSEIDCLESQTSYKFLVMAETGAGYHIRSLNPPWIIAATETEIVEPRVPDPPEMTVCLLSGNSILVVWKPASALQDMQPSGFMLYCRKQNAENPNEGGYAANLSSVVTHHVFNELALDTLYQIRLVSYNNFGESEAVTQTIMTSLQRSVSPDESPADAPFDVKATAVNSTAVKVEWSPSCGAVTNYTVRCQLAFESLSSIYLPSLENYMSSSVEGLVFGGLQPNTMYEFSVQSINNDVRSPFSKVVRCKTQEGVPSVPMNLHLSHYSGSVVELQWNPPVFQNGLIIYYMVSYTSDLLNTKWSTQKTENGSMTSLIIRDLQSNTKYYFKLQAATKAGLSPPTNTIQVYTHDLNPQPSNPGPSEQQLGIIIGTSIGLSCIVVCIIAIYVYNRRCSSVCHRSNVSYPVSNGYVMSCRCQPPEHLVPYDVVPSPPDTMASAYYQRKPADASQSNPISFANHSCDTKGGYFPSGNNGSRRLIDNDPNQEQNPLMNKHATPTSEPTLETSLLSGSTEKNRSILGRDSLDDIDYDDESEEIDDAKIVKTLENEEKCKSRSLKGSDSPFIREDGGSRTVNGKTTPILANRDSLSELIVNQPSAADLDNESIARDQVDLLNVREAAADVVRFVIANSDAGQSIVVDDGEKYDEKETSFTTPIDSNSAKRI